MHALQSNIEKINLLSTRISFVTQYFLLHFSFGSYNIIVFKSDINHFKATILLAQFDILQTKDMMWEFSENETFNFEMNHKYPYSSSAYTISYYWM